MPTHLTHHPFCHQSDPQTYGRQPSMAAIFLAAERSEWDSLTLLRIGQTESGPGGCSRKRTPVTRQASKADISLTGNRISPCNLGCLIRCRISHDPQPPACHLSSMILTPYCKRPGEFECGSGVPTRVNFISYQGVAEFAQLTRAWGDELAKDNQVDSTSSKTLSIG